MAQISLSIKGRIFNVSKDILCEYSDYFRAMFSGNYVENKQQEIKIDTLEPDTMELILKYMHMGLIDLSDHSLTTIGEIAIAASFLQITELIKQIEYILDLQISVSNWIQIMSISEQCSYAKIEKLAIVHGLLSFQNMKPEYVPSIHVLAWYLSHPFLDSESEAAIFKFGYEWLLHHETGADALLIILGCLDIKRITLTELKEIKNLVKEYENSLAAKVVDCLFDLFDKNWELSCRTLQDHKTMICQKFTERVYNEVLNNIRNSSVRKLLYTPVIPIWILKDTKPEFLPHYLFSFTHENKFHQWLEVAEKNLWGWSIVSWGPSKIVLVCGEHGRGTGIYMRDVKVYDTLRKDWIWHGVQLPHRRHAGCAVIEDSLYIIGGVGAFRVVLDTAMIYDLKQRAFRKIAKFPDSIQNPAVCSHDNIIYAAGHKNIYQYEDQGNGKDLWKTVISTEIRMSCMRSYRKYIYCIQSYFSNLYRFRPGIDKKLELITCFSSPPSTMCNMRDNLVVFTRTVSDVTSVEVLKGDTKDEKPKVMYTERDTTIRVNEVAGSCVVVLESPPTEWEVSQYVRSYLQHYNE
ncbi:unnamed protein product [Pieris brassicae]|uniref:BTB domain-containing protein n=1 Tax=Pieris brassicae TaxID=7116 RepID=A0A9P0XBG1_PIEBR|nr:unnamed protein product [Pieris brassicae]